MANAQQNAPVEIKLRRADVAYSEILRRMTQGSFHPSHHITEQKLCDMLNMSRTPVREAINRLVAEGLLLSEPHRGVRPRELSSKELIDLLSAREAIEVESARLAAPRITHEQIAELIKVCDSMDGADKEKSALQWLDVNLHMTIVELSGNGMLKDIYNRYHLLQLSIFGFYRASIYIREVWGEELGKQHMPIVDALATGDPEKAEAGAREAMRVARENYFKAFERMRQRNEIEEADYSAVVARLAGKNCKHTD